MTPHSHPQLRLVCTDFDGTIHSDDHSPAVGEEFQQLIATLQQQGVLWVVNTGRERSDLLRTMRHAVPGVSPDYLVVVEREIYVKADDQFVSHAPWNEECNRVHDRVFAAMRPAVDEWTAWVKRRFVAEVYEDPWSPFCLVAANPGEATLIVRQMEEWCRSWPEVMVMSNHIYARLSHVDYHKGSALREVAALCGARPETTFVAGDHLNDLPMLRREFAHWLMAPSNAVLEVKEAVLAAGGWIVEGVASHAVAMGLRRCLEGI